MVPIPKKKAKKSKAEIELDKMLTEARAADAKIAAEEASKPADIIAPKPEAEQPKPPAEKSDSLKWFFLGLIIVSLVGGYFLSSQLHKNPNISIPATGLAIYNPENLLGSGWALDVANTNLAEMPTSFRAEMMSQGIVDAATWEFHKGDEKLYFWTRIYSDNDTREKYDDALTMGIYWKGDTTSLLTMGDKSMVGVYKSTGDTPLMVLIESGKQIWYVSYHNRLNADGSRAYDTTNITEDKQFLVSTAKKFYESFQNST